MWSSTVRTTSRPESCSTLPRASRGSSCFVSLTVLPPAPTPISTSSSISLDRTNITRERWGRQYRSAASTDGRSCRAHRLELLGSAAHSEASSILSLRSVRARHDRANSGVFTGIHLQSHWAPRAFTGMHPQTNPQSKYPPQPFSPIPSSMFYTTYLTRDIRAQCVCSPGAGFNPAEFLSPCGLRVSCCLATPVVRSRNSKRLVAPKRVYGCICMDSAGPAWSPLAQDLYGSGRHESGICTFPSPGPWRARRLDSRMWTLVFG